MLTRKCLNRSWFLGRGWGQQLFTFQRPAVHWMAGTSSLNCLSCRNPYQTPYSLDCLPPFHWKTPFFHWKMLRRIPFWEKLNRGVSKLGCFPLCSGKVQIVSRTLSGLFLVGALNRPRRRKRTKRENPRSIPEQTGKIPEKSGKDKKGQKRTKKDKKGRTSPDRETPPFETPPFSGPWPFPKSAQTMNFQQKGWCLPNICGFFFKNLRFGLSLCHLRSVPCALNYGQGRWLNSIDRPLHNMLHNHRRNRTWPLSALFRVRLRECWPPKTPETPKN